MQDGRARQPARGRRAARRRRRARAAAQRAARRRDRASASASPATCARSRPAPSTRSPRRSSCSTAPSTAGRSPAWPARSARPTVVGAPSDEERRAGRHRGRAGSCAGTATRSTSPTRSRRVRVRAQGYELDELELDEREPNAACDDERAPLGARALTARLDERSMVDRTAAASSICAVIYCVVPEALADELFDKLDELLRRRPQRHGDRRPPQVLAPRGAQLAGGGKRERPRPPPRAGHRASSPSSPGE